LKSKHNKEIQISEIKILVRSKFLDEIMKDEKHPTITNEAMKTHCNGFDDKWSLKTKK
jgi:hypothetical protein